MTTTPDPRAACRAAFARLSAAHDALVAAVTEETLREFTDAANAAQAAHQAFVLAAFERASARRAGR